MSTMIILRCVEGARAAMALCPVCNRISRQVLLKAYTPKTIASLFSSYKCPVCGNEYTQCKEYESIDYSDTYSKYLNDAEAYNREAVCEYKKKTNSDSTSKVQNDIIQNKNPEKNDSAHSVSAQTTQEEHTSAQKSIATDSQGVSESLSRKIDYWKKELLDTGKRNRMINYRESKRQTLRIVEPDATTLFNKLAFSEKALSFQKPINKDTDYRTYSVIALMETLSYTLNVQVGDVKTAGTIVEREKTLKNMRSKAKLAQEEQGTNILYLCFGFIYWKASDRASAQWLKAPLLLMPVSLGIKSLNSPYTISKNDDEIVVNPTLDYLFRTDYNIVLPAFEQKNKKSFDEFMMKIEDIVDKRGWRLTREVSLGLLSFLKISMYHDLINYYDKIIHHPVLRAMAGERDAIGDLPDVAINFDYDSVKPGEWHEVVDSDSSQEEAILLSKLGVSFVMQGPPGTGKSQTITNIIAEALGDGKKVLFVSEKAAALQVVLKRLTEVGLDDFCLSLHNYKANKKDIIDNIGANLYLEEETISRSAANELTELFRDRNFLNSYAHELHQVLLPLGQSMYSAFGRLSSLSDASTIDFVFENITDVSDVQYASIMYCLSAFEKALRNMNGKLSDNPWHDTIVTSSGQTFQKDFENQTKGLSENLRKISDISSTLSKDIGMDYDNTISSSERVLRISKILQSKPRYMFNSWFSPRIVKRGQQALFEAQQYSRLYYQNKDRLLSDWNESVLCFSIDSFAAFFSQYQWLYHGKYSDCPDKGVIIEQSSAEKIKNQFKVIIENTKKACSITAISQDFSIVGIKTLSKILQLIKNAPCLNEEWFNYHNNSQLLEMALHAERKQKYINEKAEQIKKQWEPEIFDIDIREFIFRFKTQFTPSFLQTKDKYEQDLSVLRAHKKTSATTLNNAEIIAMLQTVIDYNSHEKWLETEMRLHPRSPFFGLYSSRFYIEKLKGTMTTCIIVIVPMWLFTPPLIHFLSRSMNDS